MSDQEESYLYVSSELPAKDTLNLHKNKRITSNLNRLGKNILFKKNRKDYVHYRTRKNEQKKKNPKENFDDYNSEYL